MSARAPRSMIDGLARPGFPRLRQHGYDSASSTKLASSHYIKRKKRFRPRLSAFAGLILFSATALTAVSLSRINIALDSSAIDRVAASLGFEITRLDVHGNRYTQRADILDALELLPGTTQLAFDIAAAKRRVEALPWVLKAGIHRSLPDGIGVEITERRPAIVWRDGERDVLLDMDGRELSTLPPGSDLGLPVVTGAAAGPLAPGFILLLEQHVELNRRTAQARRIDGRRWSLLLSNGTLVHLPPDGIAASLAWLESQALTGFLDLGLETIDLRVAGQLVVRGDAKATSETVARAHRSIRAAPAAGGAP